MSFPWLESTPSRHDGAAKRADVAARELADRAALLFRLGFSKAAATQRLTARIAWEYDPHSKHGAHSRPHTLTDEGIAKIVDATYARRPA